MKVRRIRGPNGWGWGSGWGGEFTLFNKVVRIVLFKKAILR